MSTASNKAARRFVEHPLWKEAMWIAATFRWHPTSDAPPVMGLVFADWAKGVKLFQSWTDDWGNADEFDDIRIAVIERDKSPDEPGYAIRISAVADVSVALEPDHRGQWQWMHLLPGMPNMLADFKREYLKHGEFLLAPVVERDDKQLWFNANAGIIKRELVLRQTSDLKAGDPDAIVLEQSDDASDLAKMIAEFQAAAGQQIDLPET